MNSETIEVAALGRPLYPGMLYDCRNHSFIPGAVSTIHVKKCHVLYLANKYEVSDGLLSPAHVQYITYSCTKASLDISGVTLWDKKTVSENLDTRPQLQTDVKFSSSDSLSSKSSLLDVEASLKASFMSGKVEFGGSVKYMTNTKSSSQQCRVTMLYSETTRFEQLTMSQLDHITYPQVFDHKNATHVITAVLYGAHAFMLFDRMLAENENKRDIEVKVSLMVKGISTFSIDAEGDVKMSDEQKTMAEKMDCTFYGDFHLEQNPTTFAEAVKTYKQLPTLLKDNPQNVVPLKVWLYPLHLFDTKAAQLVREISTSLVFNTEDVMEELGEVERRCNDLLENALVNVFSDVRERLRSFQSSMRTYRLILQNALSRVLPAIRGGQLEEQSLQDVLDTDHRSPFNASALNQWLDDTTSELNLLSANLYFLTPEKIETKDSDGLTSFLIYPGNEKVACLAFTSLTYEDPYLSNLNDLLKSDEFKKLDGKTTFEPVPSVTKWFKNPDVIPQMRENLRKFLSFFTDQQAQMVFIISAISDPDHLGSSIYMYERGKLTDKQFQNQIPDVQVKKE